jgi:hypothetical protein
MNIENITLKHVIAMILFIVFDYTAIEIFIFKKRKN